MVLLNIETTILSIESRIAFMRNEVKFHDKKWEKNQMLSQLSLLPPLFSLSVIVICIFLLSSIHIDLSVG